MASIVNIIAIQVVYSFNTDTVTGAYFCMNMVLITLSTFLAVVVIQTHIRGDRINPVPRWLKRVRIVLRLTVDGTLVPASG